MIPDILDLWTVTLTDWQGEAHETIYMCGPLEWCKQFLAAYARKPDMVANFSRFGRVVNVDETPVEVMV